jgi:hypothetical protein
MLGYAEHSSAQLGGYNPKLSGWIYLNISEQYPYLFLLYHIRIEYKYDTVLAGGYNTPNPYSYHISTMASSS